MALLKPILFVKQKFSERQFFIISSVIVGLISGLAAIMLKYAVHNIGRLIAHTRNSEESLLYGLFPLFGILLTVFFVKFFLNDGIKKGNAEIVYAIVKKS